MRLASVYARKNDILIHASSMTTTGLWIMSEPIARLESDAADDALGAAVRAALEGSRQGVPHPAVWTGFFDPVLKLAKVKSWSTFLKGARLVGVEQDAGNIKLTPTRNVGPKEGFQNEPSAAVVVPEDASAAALGAAARAALARAT